MTVNIEIIIEIDIEQIELNAECRYDRNYIQKFRFDETVRDITRNSIWREASKTSQPVV